MKPPVRLCAGRLEIDNPEDILREYVDPASDSAYPDYDRLVTNGRPDLVDADLLAPTLLGAPVDRARFRVLRDMLPQLRAVADLPPVALQDAGDADIEQVAALFDVLDTQRYRRAGVRGTVVAKVLHRKRPDLVPLYDSRIFEAYTLAAVRRVREQTWAAFLVELCAAMRHDLRREATRFAELEEQCIDLGAPLTRLRILDILVWTAAGDWQ